jgi:hypothetical protein
MFILGKDKLNGIYEKRKGNDVWKTEEQRWIMQMASQSVKSHVAYKYIAYEHVRLHTNT